MILLCCLGRVTFSLPEREYKARADYLAGKYWSGVFAWTDETIGIDEGFAGITVTSMGHPLDRVRVYVFGETGSYSGLYTDTDANGEALYRLPEGVYNFRADYMGNRYWSGNVTIMPHVINPVEVSTGGGSLVLTVLKGEEDPVKDATCYLFNASGSYLGESRVTDQKGEAGFNFADGTYRVRVDHLGYRFWTEDFTVPETATLDYMIPHKDVTVTVKGDDDGDIIPIEGLKAYLFTPSDAYLGVYGMTDDQGLVTFNLPGKDCKVRVDYLTRQYWSGVFQWTDETITVNEGVAEVHLLQGSVPVPGVNIYVFNGSDAYLGISAKTDQDGMVRFRLPEGTYKFRGDYLGSKYWSTETVAPHQVNVIPMETGGGAFSLTVEKEQGLPLADVPVYAFDYSGKYLGVSSRTDGEGRVAFDLSDGDYTFRVDYLGYRFWTGVITVPSSLSDTLTIPHRDVTITVNGVYGEDETPLVNTKAYLFTSGGSYMGVQGVTNDLGRVTFNLPEKDYKVRADYLGGRYWSDTVTWEDQAIGIPHGTLNVDVTFNGENVIDAPVYLFTESGTYLGTYERTDYYGHTAFSVPATAYKFRVDHEGTRYWSEVINVIPHQETDVILALDQLALNLTNDPKPARINQLGPELLPGAIRVAGIGSLAGILSQAVIAQSPSPEVYYYINDHLGTPQMITDNYGEVVWKAEYEPFGEADVDYTSTIGNNFGFPGQYFDQETGLHYNYHRYYDPSTGRYLRPDPIGLKGGINLFLYAVNSPINAIDPFALYTWPYTWKGWAGLVFTTAGAVTVIIPGGLPIGIGLLAIGGAFTIWDMVEGFNKAERDAKAVTRKLIKNKIEQAGGDAKWLQEKALIPSTKKLKELGFSDEELKEWGLIEENCKF